MLIDLLASGNYVNYNIKLAQFLGLHPAIYLSELMNINEKALRKHKVADNTFTLDREYIKSRTTLSVEEQLDIDKTLLKIGILTESSTTDSIQLNITTLTSILMSPDEDLTKDISKLANLKKTAKQTKAEKICETIKSNIVTTNPKLREAYSEWIDTIYAKFSFINKPMIITAQQVISQFCGNDVDTALKVVDIATINAWKDMQYAINSYQKNYGPTYKVKAPIVEQVPTTLKKRLSDEVF